MATKDVAQIDPKELDGQRSFQQWLDRGVTPLSDVSGQWTLVEKTSLVGVPFLVLEWDPQNGEKFGRDYVNVKVLTVTNERLCFNDGGVGIRPVVEAWCSLDERPEDKPPMYCPRGLRVSEYINDAGIAGTTYYFA